MLNSDRFVSDCVKDSMGFNGRNAKIGVQKTKNRKKCKKGRKNEQKMKHINENETLIEFNFSFFLTKPKYRNFCYSPLKSENITTNITIKTLCL